ncbi:MAG: DUF2177 family protein [Rhodoferax sp.]|nr:DUF2177 family protein [Rhodoferax sp.]
MMRWLAAWMACIVVMLVLDAAWIGGIAQPVYQQGIGHLMAEQFDGVAAAAFYLMYGVALMVFAVAPGGVTTPWRGTLARGALFGLFAYATYDLTNMATLRDWPLAMSLMDMAWGSMASLAAVAGGKSVFDRVGRRR